jgi:hypothetical protein
MNIFFVLLLFLLFYFIYYNSKLEQFSNNKVKYPACFTLDKNIKNVYDFFEKKKLLKKASFLLNIYSIVLCRQKKIKKNNINDEIMKFKKLGFNKIINKDYIKYESIVNNIISTDQRLKMNPESKMFLTATTYFIENESYKLKKYLFPSEFISLQDINKNFYKLYYPKF